MTYDEFMAKQTSRYRELAKQEAEAEAERDSLAQRMLDLDELIARLDTQRLIEMK